MLLIIIRVMCTPPRARKNQNQLLREEKLSYFARKMLCFKEIYQELEEK